MISPRDMRHMPLPAAAPIWNARNPQQWLQSMQDYSLFMTLDTLMNKTFDVEGHGKFSGVCPNLAAATDRLAVGALGLFGPPTRSTYSPDCFATRIFAGPFARLCLVLTLLRGLIEFGEGRRMGGQVSQIWAIPNAGVGGERAQTTGPGADRVALETITLAAYKRGFDRVSFVLHFPSPHKPIR